MPFPPARRAASRGRPRPYANPSHSYCPPHDSTSIADWRTLQVGDEIIILDADDRPIRGHIDDLDAAASVLWIDQVEHRGRRLFTRSDMRSLWLLPKPSLRRKSQRAEPRQSSENLLSSGQP